MQTAQVAGHAAPRARRHPQAHARRPPRGPQGPHLGRPLLLRPALPPGASPPPPCGPFPKLHTHTHTRAHARTHARMHSGTRACTNTHVTTARQAIAKVRTHASLHPRHLHACASHTAGDCHGGGRQPHLSHGAWAHCHRRPGSRAIARNRPPHTLRTQGRWHEKGCKQKQADSWCGRPAGTNMRRNQWHSPVIWRLFFREAAELLAVCFVSSLSSCYICAPLSLTLVYTKVFTSRIIIVHSSTL